MLVTLTGLAAMVVFGASSVNPGVAREHRIKLSSFVMPPAGTVGMLLKARVDGGPELRLLLDSGAQYLVLNRKAAARSGQAASAEMDVVGVGGPARTAGQARAAMVEVSDLVLFDCPVLIMDGRVLDGIDGVMPLSIFADFLVHLDVPGRTLTLEPYGGEPGAGFVEAREDRGMLFLPASLEGRHEGYLLLDTGSSYNAVSTTAARALSWSESMAASIPLTGGAGATKGAVYTTGVRFQMGARKMEMQPVVAVDLAEMTRHHGMPVNGVIGYPALSNSVVTVNYRQGQVRIQRK